MAITASLDLSGLDDHVAVPLGTAGPSPDPPGGLRALLSLKSAGDLRHDPAGPVPDRLRLLARLGIDPGRVYGCRQVHSRRVVTVREGEPADFAAVPVGAADAVAAFAALEADGLITRLPGAWLAVTVADCLPIWLADRRGGAGRARGLVHSGWQGTGILREAIRRMRDELGVPPEALAVTIGPGIGPCCYAVPEERYAAFRAEFGAAAVREVPGAADGARGSEDGTAPGAPQRRFRLDLRAANLRILEEEGVHDVRVVADCTACTPRLSSFRRDGAAGFGRMLALIGAEDGA